MTWKRFRKGMNIVIIGFMGSGKTVVSRTLGKKMKMDFLEMDDFIIKKSGRRTVNSIFDKDGERRFRELEVEVAKELSKRKNSVISTGGGIVLNKISLDYLRENGYVIHLRTSFAEANRRLKDFHDRPLFRNPREARKLYNFRKALYREYSDNYVRTDGKTIDEVSEDIIDLVHDQM